MGIIKSSQLFVGVFLILFLLLLFIQWIDEKEGKKPKWHSSKWLGSIVVSLIVSLSLIFILNGMFLELLLPLFILIGFTLYDISERKAFLDQQEERYREERIRASRWKLDASRKREREEQRRLELERIRNEKNKNRYREVIPQNIKDQVWNRDGGKCVECGSNENLEFDHIIPHSKGGADSYRNLQLLCQPCNGKKSNKIG